jgi:hypothetical protein
MRSRLPVQFKLPAIYYNKAKVSQQLGGILIGCNPCRSLVQFGAQRDKKTQ